MGTRFVLNLPHIIDYAKSLLSSVNERKQVITGVDGNDIDLYVTVPKETESDCASAMVQLPKKYVLFLHGGAMAVFSTGAATWRVWSRLIAKEGLGVVSVDFRNCVSSPGDGSAHPFPAGLNDCVSALKWLCEQPSVQHITVIGESGGANLAISTCVRFAKTQAKAKTKVSGIVAMDPYIAGPFIWRNWRERAQDFSSLTEHDGACFPSDDMLNMGRVYTPEEKDWTNGEAWPLFLKDEEIDLLPKTVVYTSELDSLRSEGEKLVDMLQRRGRLRKHVRCERMTHTIHGYAPAIGMMERTAKAAKGVAEFALSSGASSEKEKEKGQIKDKIARI